jgi:hypothetical protein
MSATAIFSKHSILLAFVEYHNGIHLFICQKNCNKRGNKYKGRKNIKMKGSGIK